MISLSVAVLAREPAEIDGRRVVVVGTPPNHPISVLDDDSPPTGIAVEIVEAVARIHGWHVRYVEGSWADLRQAMERNDVDLTVGIAFTEERADTFAFSNETIISNWAVVYRRPGVRIEDFLELDGKRIASAARGVHTEAFFRIARSFGIAFEHIPTSSREEAMELVSSDKADAAIVPRTFHIAKGHEYRAIATHVIFNPVQVRFAAPLGESADILQALDAFMAAGRADPNSEYSRIVRHWLNDMERPVPTPVWLYSATVMSLATVLFLALISRRLYKQVHEKIADLSASEARFRGFSELAADTFWEADAQDRFISVWGNIDRFGKNSREIAAGLIGKRFRETVRANYDLEHLREQEQLIRDRQTYRGVVRPSFIVEGAWISVSGAPVFDEEGRFVGSRGSNLDVTERVTLEQQLFRAQRMEAIGHLSGGVAHDFNNVMSTILGSVELLELSFEPSPEQQRHFHSVYRSVDRATSLTSRLLTFARRQPLSPAATDIGLMVTDLQELLQRTLGETIELQVTTASDVAPAFVDAAQFENALLNLTLNARDAMPNGGMLRIETANAVVEAESAAAYGGLKPGDFVCVAVADDGVGMTPQVIESAFEPFFSTKGPDKGTGLGLSMVYGFVKQTGGHIDIESAPGLGTTVRLLLPTAEPLAAADAAPRKPRHPRKPERSGRILVIEDDVDVRDVAEAMLVRAGFEVSTANDAASALRLLKTAGRFDLLFTDVVLPHGMDGVALAKAAVEFQPTIKVLLASGYTDNATPENGSLAHEAAFLQKPYRAERLLAMVDALLAGRRSGEIRAGTAD